MKSLLRTFAVLLAISSMAAPALAGGRGRAKQTRVTKQPAKSKKRVILLVGMPGSGKSFVSGKLAAKLGIKAPLISGDIIRDAVGKTASPAERIKKTTAVANAFAKQKGEIGRRMALKAKKMGSDVVIIEGFRSPADVASFRKSFPNTTVVSLEVPAKLRHSRMLKRGRSGEDNGAYLRKRDAREKGTGLGEIMKNADLKVRVKSNNASEVERVLSTISQQVGAN